MEKNRGPTFCFFGQKTENDKPVFSILFFFFPKNRNESDIIKQNLFFSGGENFLEKKKQKPVPI